MEVDEKQGRDGPEELKWARPMACGREWPHCFLICQLDGILASAGVKFIFKKNYISFTNCRTGRLLEGHLSDVCNIVEIINGSTNEWAAAFCVEQIVTL
jgi:hypothetical protein